MADSNAGVGSVGESPAPPGWYPTEQGQKYWDGGQWTTQSPPMMPSAQMPPSMQPLHPSGISSDDRTTAMLAHLLGIVVGILAPIVIYFMKKDQSPFVRHHAAQALNLALTFLAVLFGLLAVVALLGVGVVLVIPDAGFGVVTLLYIGFMFLLVAASIANLVLTIMAGLAANRGEWYRYPYCFNWVK